jgi:protein TonB
MFDQSLLLDHGGSRKAGALATSFVAQMLAAGVLLVAPFLFHETLAFRLGPVVDYYPLAAAPQVPAAKASPETKGAAFDTRPVFRAPARDRLAPSQTDSVGLAMDAPALDFGLSTADIANRFAQQRTFAIPEMTAAPKPQAAVSEPAKPTAAPIRVSQGVMAAKLIRKVVPVYPPLARQVRVQGTVHLVGIVDRDGTIQQLRVLSGHPLLVEAALAAVRQWVYQPTLLNGEPVQVVAPIDVTFTLSQ